MKNSIGSSIFRFFVVCIALFFLGMLYWSNSLIEEDLKNLQASLKDLKSDLQSMQLNAINLPQETAKEQTVSARPQMDASLPNLLEEDLFYKETLPKILGKGFKPIGARTQGVLGKPEHLHPFNGFKDVKIFQNLCSITVADLQFGKYESMAPSAATKMEQRNENEFWVHLRNDLYWQPLRQEHFPNNVKLASHFLKRHPLTAHDFKFFFDAIMNLNISESSAAALRNYYGDIEEFKVIDDLTFFVRWKTNTVVQEGIEKQKIKYTAKSLTGGLQPLASFLYKYFSDGTKIIDNDEDPDTYRKNSVWAQNFIQHWAKNIIPSCGAWIFDGFSDQAIRFKRNPHFFKPYGALTEEQVYFFKESFEGIWQDFKAGKIDVCSIAPSQLPELQTFLASAGYQSQIKDSLWEVKEINYVDRAYYYIGWNERSPLFEDPKIRQALTMAIDRERIIEQNLNKLGIAINGPFYRYSAANDPTVDDWPFDPNESKRILEKAGWIDRNGDGIRDKFVDGKLVSFSFTLTYFVKNLSTKVIAEYIQTSLKDIGIDCKLNGVDIADLSHTFEDKSFDAIFMGWSFGTPPDEPKQIWHSSGAKEKGSSNSIGFSNPEIDQIIDELQYEYDKNKRIELYHRFHRIIREQEPYTFLYSPINKMLYRNYVKNLFIPMDRQDLIPGADVSEPDLGVTFNVPHQEL